MIRDFADDLYGDPERFQGFAYVRFGNIKIGVAHVSSITSNYPFNDETEDTIDGIKITYQKEFNFN